MNALEENVMALCPLCGVEAPLAHVEIEKLIVELITRDHPEWKREDGSCPGCLSYYEDLTKAGAVGVDVDVEAEQT